MSGVSEPLLISAVILIAAVCGWNYLQIQILNRRLAALEKQHLALVADLEERLYESVAR
jgi:hypothetical protein